MCQTTTIAGVGRGGVAATVTVHKALRLLTYTQAPSLILPDHMATMLMFT